MASLYTAILITHATDFNRLDVPLPRVCPVSRDRCRPRWADNNGEPPLPAPAGGAHVMLVHMFTPHCGVLGAAIVAATDTRHGGRVRSSVYRVPR